MKELILPIVTLVLCIGGAVAMFVMQRKVTGKKNVSDEQRREKEQMTAQDFVNVKEIKDIFLYTNDNHLITYVKVQPFSFDLLTKAEKLLMTRKLTSELSQMNCPFKFIAVSRPVDISAIVNQYNELLFNSEDQIQKQLLRAAIMKLNEFSLSGEVVQREFYYMLWSNKVDETQELRKTTREFLDHIENAGLKGEILNQNGIIKLCNLVNNPAFATTEELSVDENVPFINLMEE